MKRIATTLLVAGLLATPMFALSPPAHAGVSIGIGVSVGIPPPVLPVYAQPIAPGPGFIWTPGYWGWDQVTGYYWVPGTWVRPPRIGLLWTPGWWGWSEGFYRWHGGYWGTHVGFYGGVNYGFGYFGTGYRGGYWRGNRFFYNRAVNNINVTRVRNVYMDKTVINNVHTDRVSYNGGRGGIAAQPTAQQRGWANEHRYQPTAMQTRQHATAMRDPAQRFNTNHGQPAVFATRQAGRFESRQATRASGNPASADRSRRNDGFVHAPRNASMHTTQTGAPARHATMESEGYSARARRGGDQPRPQAGAESRQSSWQTEGRHENRGPERHQERKQERHQDGKQERGDDHKHGGRS